jgi:hypothetical protein
MKSLTALDPSKLPRSNLRLVQWDLEGFEQRLRTQIRRQHPKDASARLIAFAKRYGQLEYVQRVHDQYRTTLIETPRLVQFSHSLTWGAKRRALHRHMVKVIDDDLYSMSY